MVLRDYFSLSDHVTGWGTVSTFGLFIQDVWKGFWTKPWLSSLRCKVPSPTKLCISSCLHVMLYHIQGGLQRSRWPIFMCIPLLCAWRLPAARRGYPRGGDMMWAFHLWYVLELFGQIIKGCEIERGQRKGQISDRCTRRRYHRQWENVRDC